MHKKYFFTILDLAVTAYTIINMWEKRMERLQLRNARPHTRAFRAAVKHGRMSETLERIGRIMRELFSLRRAVFCVLTLGMSVSAMFVFAMIRFKTFPSDMLLMVFVVAFAAVMAIFITDMIMRKIAKKIAEKAKDFSESSKVIRGYVREINQSVERMNERIRVIGRIPEADERTIEEAARGRNYPQRQERSEAGGESEGDL